MSTERLAKQAPTVWPKYRLFCTFFPTIGRGEVMRGLWHYCRRVFTRTLSVRQSFPPNMTPSRRRIFPNTSARCSDQQAYGALNHPQRSLRLFTKAFSTPFFSAFSQIAGQDRPCRMVRSAQRLFTKGLDRVYRKSFPSSCDVRERLLGRACVCLAAGRRVWPERGAVCLSAGG